MGDRPVEKGSKLPEPSPGEDRIEFLNPSDDTPENRAIVRLVEERIGADQAVQPTELGDVIDEFGFDHAEFLLPD